MALKSVVLGPGECIVLPADAVINSVLVTGAASVTSTCGDFPPLDTYKCGLFSVFIDEDGGTGDPNDETDTYVSYIKIGSNTYNMNELLFDVMTQGESKLNTHLTTNEQAIIKFMDVTNLTLADRTLIWIYFQAPESLYDTIEMELTNFGNAFYLKPYDATCGVYSNPT